MKEKKKEDLVKDLVKKVKRGELTPKEAKAEVLKTGLHHKKYETKYSKRAAPFAIAGIILCFLLLIAKQTGWGILSFFAQLPLIVFPQIVLYATGAIFIVVSILGTYGTYLRNLFSPKFWLPFSQKSCYPFNEIFGTCGYDLNL